ncbi:MAG: HAD-IB family hydrolase [bacterium]|nr:HAD-IB family hydrolase [bacterium]
MKSQKVAIFDIDGTIFRSSLLIQVTDGLVEKGIMPKKIKHKYELAHKQWLDREGPYEDYIDAVIKAFVKNIKGVSQKEFLKVAEQVVSKQHHRIYRYTRDLVKDLKKKKYFMLAISHSPKDILDEFCEELGFDKVYGQIYEVQNNKYSGKTLYRNLILEKSKILQRAIEKEGLSLRGSIGVGDTESDSSFLRKVDNPICFNPNQELYKIAQRNKWQIVVERKNVIYKIK